MLLQSCSSFGAVTSHRLLQSRNRRIIISIGADLFVRKKANAASLSTFVCLGAGTDAIAEIAQNKVLIATTVSAAIGQLSKPFTSAILYGNKFDFKAAFQAGGFPSTHSSATVATALSLGLERGFSDAIFGLAVVYAGLTMYDAQGVRWEVGTHAKELNRILLSTRLNSISSCDADSLIDSSSGKPSSNLESDDPRLLEKPTSFRPKQTKASLLDDRKSRITQTLISSSLTADFKGRSENVAHCHSPLKESVGHTVIEVIAGALLGFCVGLAVYAV